MTLFLGNHQIADCRMQTVALHPIIGGYEIVFPLYLSISTTRNGLHKASIAGARIVVKPDHGKPMPLGFARPELPADIVSSPHPSTATPSLHLRLQPTQIAVLETLRGTGDLTFQLSLSGTAIDRHPPQYLNGDYTLAVPRSDWLEKLRNAGARNVLLLELPLPLKRDSEDHTPISSDLIRAENRYRDGDYHGCINSCRTAIEEAALCLFGKHELPAALDLLGSKRADMTKYERCAALYAVLRHYTHQAHHGPSDGGVSGYTRSDAHFILALTAAAVAHALEHLT